MERPHRQDVTPAIDAFERFPLFAQNPGRLGRQVTVPMRAVERDKPIVARGLVEERALHRHRAPREEQPNLAGHVVRKCEELYRRLA